MKVWKIYISQKLQNLNINIIIYVYWIVIYETRVKKIYVPKKIAAGKHCRNKANKEAVVYGIL